MSGPLAYRMGKGMRPDVAAAFDRMAAAAAGDRIYLSITSAFRSDAEQARLFAANPNPKWVAPPGTSLHRYATELDLGPPGAYALAGRQRPALRLHPQVRLGSLALRLWRQPARSRAPGAVRARVVGASGRRPRADDPRAAVVRSRSFRGPARPGRAAMERARGSAGRPALRGVRLQPVCPERGGGGGHRPVHAGHGAGVRPRRSVRRGRGDRRPGPPDERPAAPVRRQRGPGARRRTTREPGRWHATAACRRTPRPVRMWPESWGFWVGPGTCSPPHRSGWSWWNEPCDRCSRVREGVVCPTPKIRRSAYG